MQILLLYYPSSVQGFTSEEKNTLYKAPWQLFFNDYPPCYIHSPFDLSEITLVNFLPNSQAWAPALAAYHASFTWTNGSFKQKVPAFDFLPSVWEKQGEWGIEVEHNLPE